MTGELRLRQLFDELGCNKYFDLVSYDPATDKFVVVCKECGDTFNYCVRKRVYCPQKSGRICCKTCGIKEDGSINYARFLKHAGAGELYESGKSVREIAERFSVSKCIVNNFVKLNHLTNGKNWREQSIVCNKKRHEDAIALHPGILAWNKHSHRAKKFGCVYEVGITLKRLIERDGLVCRICGEECDANDTRYGSNGPLYPSIDHIIPLSKGGAHSWSNVQIAHCICNSRKGAAYEV